MYEWKVELTYGTHYLFADDYSVSGGLYIFWIGKTNVRSFRESEVVNVSRVGSASTERPR
jgi:hypothetical protein